MFLSSFTLAVSVAASGRLENDVGGVDVGDSSVVIAALTHSELFDYLSIRSWNAQTF